MNNISVVITMIIFFAINFFLIRNEQTNIVNELKQINKKLDSFVEWTVGKNE